MNDSRPTLEFLIIGVNIFIIRQVAARHCHYTAALGSWNNADVVGICHRHRRRSRGGGQAVLDLPGGWGVRPAQDRSLIPPAKVGQMYWGL